MPRRPAAAVAQTHRAIVERAVDVASVEGLEGLTLGRLAVEASISKSGLLGHFGTKEALQRETLAAAVDGFRRTVWDPAAAREPGLPRLRAICHHWLGYLEESAPPGGCFLSAASTELDGRPGPVRDLAEATMRRWLGVLAGEADVATRAGDLPAGADPRQVAYELNALAMGANQARQLLRDPDAIDRARRGMGRVLGAPPAP